MANDTPIILFSKQTKKTNTPTRSGDCTDCACSDGSFSRPTTINYQIVKLAQPHLHKQNLSLNQTLLFNPLHGGSVAVLNTSAYKIWNEFQQPRLLPSMDKYKTRGTIGTMVNLGLLLPYELHSTGYHQQKQPSILTAWLHVTNACNLRCPYCYLHKTPESMELAHGKLSIESIFRSATSNNFKRVKIKYSGGEATLKTKTVFALHQYADELAQRHDLQLDGVILSNGVAYTPRLVDEIKQSGLRLMISLDGVGKVHDVQRPFPSGKGSFSHIERSLGLLQEADITPFISITITNRNLHGLADTVRYVLGRKLPFSLNFFRENDCADPFSDLSYSDDEIISAMEDAFAVIENDLPPYSLMGSILDRANLSAPHERPCGVGQNYLVIDQNGKVAKCHMEIEHSITDISVSDPLAIVRADTIHLQNPSVDEKEGCRDCEWKYWCAGGCPALTYRATGRFDVKSPNCNIYKALFPAVLRLEALRLLKYSDVSINDDAVEDCAIPLDLTQELVMA